MRGVHAVVALAAAACQAHDPALQQKVDALAVQLAAIQRDVASVREAVARPPAMPPELAAKLDDLTRRIEQLAAQLAANKPRPARPSADPTKMYAIKVDGFPSEGPATAKVTMVTIFDYADPYTEKSRATRAELRKKYGNDLRIVYRDLVVHPTVATAAALGGCAANKQHKFFGYDALAWTNGFTARSFDHDTDTGAHCWEAAAGCPVTESFARDAGLDLARFKRDQRGACVDELRADQADLTRFKVGATPTFFINGRVLVGAMPIEQFETLIDEELAKANERIAAGARAATYYNDVVMAQGLTSVE